MANDIHEQMTHSLSLSLSQRERERERENLHHPHCTKTYSMLLA